MMRIQIVAFAFATFIAGVKSMGNQQQQCRDGHQNCCTWAAQSECNRNPYWMRVNCGQSCGTCGANYANAMQFNPRPNTGNCQRGGNQGWQQQWQQPRPIQQQWQQPQQWQQQQQRQQPQQWQQSQQWQQPQQGQMRGPCRDSNQYCAFWAWSGECKRNSRWMQSNCGQSCRSC